MLQGKRILIGISGSIAAYKCVELVRLFVKNGAEVKVLMTPSAKDFVSPLVLSTLSKNDVLIDMFAENSWSNHVQLGRWADIMLIAPLSCNTLSKMANGLCDNLLMAVYLSATCPVVVAPAMDEDMWKHPTTIANLERIRSFGVTSIAPQKGELASGLIGEGRMEEPEQIFSFISTFLSPTHDLKDKNVLITAGPTHEALDPVRYIGNHSSGKMGFALAKECKSRGANVTLVVGPTQTKDDLLGITVIKVISSDEMYAACHEHFENTDITIMAAAVADYKPEQISENKIKKDNADLHLHLIKTKDILQSLGEKKLQKQILVGFALESANEEDYALKKLTTKNADFIVLNSLKDGNLFGSDTNKITIYSKSGKKFSFDMKSKNAVAKDIIDTIVAQSQI